MTASFEILSNSSVIIVQLLAASLNEAQRDTGADGSITCSLDSRNAMCTPEFNVLFPDMFMLQYRSWGRELDEGRVPEGITAMLEELGAVKQEK